MTAAAEELAYLGAAGLASLVRERRVSPVELVRVYLERIERLDARLRAYITVLPEAALEAAHKAEAAVMRGEALAPLHGVPYAVKDQFDTASVRTTLGSRILRHHAPVEDATVVSRMAGAGALLLGKLNMTEFALGGSSRSVSPAIPGISTTTPAARRRARASPWRRDSAPSPWVRTPAAPYGRRRPGAASSASVRRGGASPATAASR